MVDFENVNVGWWQKRLDHAGELIMKTDSLKHWNIYESHSKYISKIESCETLVHYFDFTNVRSHTRSQKSYAKATSCRLKGNQYFGKKKFAEALQCYNEGITYAPQCHQQVTDDEYTLCLANRSATLFHLSQYQSCLMDIEEALMRNYQPMSRLLIRKVQCLYQMQQFEEAKKCCECVQRNVDALEEEAKQDQARNEVEKLFEKLEKVSTERTNIKEGSIPDPPRVKGSAGSILQQASDHIKLEFNVDKGRYLLADKSLEAGDVLIVEKPYVSLLLPPFYSERCYHCLKPLKNLYPCPTCTEINFCSSKCSSAALESYHDLECPLMHILNEVGIAHLALRILVSTKLSKLLELREKLSGETVFIPDEKSPLVCNYEAVYHLVHNTHNIHPQDLFQYAMTATLLLKCLDSSNYFNSCEQSSASDTRDFIGGLLMRHICQLVCNAHAITDLHLKGLDGRVESEEQVRIATAIYPTASMMNHSCSPNISSTFQGELLVVKATSSIGEGQEIFNCYGPHSKHMPKKERRAKLREQYGFLCSCVACTSESDADFDQLTLAFKCQKCQGKVRIQGMEVDVSDLPQCIECGAVCSAKWVDEVNSSFGESLHIFQEGLLLLNQKDVTRARRTFERCYRLRKKICHKLNLKLAEVIDVLAQCHALEGDFAKADWYLESSVKIIKEIYGKDGLEYAHDLRKHAEVCVQAGKYKEAHEYATEASGIFVRYYGKEHESVEELWNIISTLNVLNLNKQY